MPFGSLSPIGISLMGSASPKFKQKPAPLRSQNFETNLGESLNIEKQYFYKAIAKLVSKSDSSPNASA